MVWPDKVGRTCSRVGRRVFFALRFAKLSDGGGVRSLAPRPLWHDVSWVFCDRYGCSVDTDLIHPDGHHYADDADFFCADCWPSESG
jgi:hypothetical protein